MRNFIKICFLVVVFCFSSTSTVFADDTKVNLEKRDKIYNWIKKNIIGKTTVTEKKTNRIANDTVEAIFSSKVIYSNLVKSERGFFFDRIWIVEQENYDLDKDKKRIGSPRNQNRAGVARIEVHVSKSTGELVGIFRSLTNSIVDVTGEATRIRVRLENDKLITDLHFINYGDFFAKGGGFKPGGSIASGIYWIEDGKLNYKHKSTGYNLDPETLEKISVSSTSERLSKEN